VRVPFRVVLCPSDLSPIGDLAVPVAYRLVADEGQLHLLHVCEPPYLGNPVYGQFVQGWAPSAEEIRLGEEKARQRLHALVPEGALARGVRTEVHVAHGVQVANVIEEWARRLHADVIVLGTHGRTGLGRILMGSVATDVVKKPDLPVILVHQDLAAPRA
jgi:nucleotide-binding universal stress UspA family protein